MEVQINEHSLASSSDDKRETINPATEEKLNSYPLDSKERVAQKLSLCHEAFQKWSQMDLSERKKPIKKMISLLEEDKDEIAKIMSTEMGKPIAQGYQEIELCKSIIEYSLESAEDALADEDRDLQEGRALISYRPQGVILAIQPWNFPFYQVLRYAIPVLLSGNTTLLKHASCVWGSAKKIEELFNKAGLLKGAFIHLYAKSDDIEDLYSAQEVRGVTFTGSADTGRIVAQKAAENLKKSVLELGGNDAYLILEDADIELAAQACAFGRLINNGETCTSAKRFIVHENVYDDFKKTFKKYMQEAQMGDPLEKTTKVGPMARKDLFDKLDDQVQESLDQGATVVMGGNKEKRKGYFFQPTILENLKPGMPAYDDELFGPVASLIKVSSEQEAIDVANSSKYGLAGGIFSKDVDHALEIAKFKLDTGQVNINGFVNARPHIPFGGVKNSGYGREHDRFSFREFLNIKSIKIIKDQEF